MNSCVDCRYCKIVQIEPGICAGIYECHAFGVMQNRVTGQLTYPQCEMIREKCGDECQAFELGGITGFIKRLLHR